jgi:hypothetical protein
LWWKKVMTKVTELSTSRILKAHHHRSSDTEG